MFARSGIQRRWERSLRLGLARAAAAHKSRDTAEQSNSLATGDKRSRRHTHISLHPAASSPSPGNFVLFSLSSIRKKMRLCLQNIPSIHHIKKLSGKSCVSGKADIVC
jgi:hypothetical protein